MKNFLQFVIPLLIIVIVGFIMMRSNGPEDDEKKLYVKCNSVNKSYNAVSGDMIAFAPKDEACKMEIEAINVSREFIKIGTPYLWRLDRLGNIDETEPRKAHIIEVNQIVVLYSYDRKTKYSFEYK